MLVLSGILKIYLNLLKIILKGCVMANTLTNIMPKILARALLSLRTRCIMPRLVNSDYGSEASKKGTTIDVPVPTAVGTTSVSPSHTNVGPTALTPAYVQISLDQWYQNNPIGLTDKELCEIDANEHFLPMQLMEAVKALASVVNQHIVGKYKGVSRGVYGFISNPSVGVGTILDPFGTGVTDTSVVRAATNAKKVLNRQLCPRSDRRGLLNFDSEAAALDLAQFSDAEKIMSAAVKMEGEIGRKFGIDWVADDDVPDHTCGTAYDKSPLDVTVLDTEDKGSVAIGLVDSDAALETIVQGDILTIAGDSQTYVVIGVGPYVLNSASAAVEVGILPALKVACTGGEVVSIKNSHAVNMVFHRDAFAFATRPLLDVSQNYSLGTQMLSMQDPVTGLILRLEVSRQHKQTVWEYDILWGADLIRPELAMRIAGAV